jgi:hypothetical protein
MMPILKIPLIIYYLKRQQRMLLYLRVCPVLLIEVKNNTEIFSQVLNISTFNKKQRLKKSINDSMILSLLMHTKKILVLDQHQIRINIATAYFACLKKMLKFNSILVLFQINLLYVLNAD